eukprot:1330298-Amorphochlora_amoeboformis.AAC.2
MTKHFFVAGMESNERKSSFRDARSYLESLIYRRSLQSSERKESKRSRTQAEIASLLQLRGRQYSILSSPLASADEDGHSNDEDEEEMLQEEVRAKVISEMGVVGWKAYSELTSGRKIYGYPLNLIEFLQNIVEVFSRTLGNCQDGRPSKKLERFLEAMPRLEDIKVCECLSECLFLKLALDMHDAYLMVFDRPLYK